MASPLKDKQASTEACVKNELLNNSPNGYASSVPVRARYYFNLTNGDLMIRDDEGTEATSIQAAVVSAMEVVEELRAQDPLKAEEWKGWRMEIVDASGQAVQIIPLDVLSAH